MLWQDALARRLIALSGVGSIAAVALVGLFLVWVALPLLAPARFDQTRDLPPTGGSDRAVVVAGIDNYGLMSWGLTPDGGIVVRSLADGAPVARLQVGAGEAPTAWAFGFGTGSAAFGYGDGRTRIVDFNWQTRFLTDDEVPADLRGLGVGQSRIWRAGILVRTPAGQWRHQMLTLDAHEAVVLGAAEIRLIDLARTTSGLVLTALDADNLFHYRKLTMKTNMLTGEVRVQARGGELDLAGMPEAGKMAFKALHLDGTGDFAVLLSADGTALRLARRGSGFTVAGSQDLVADPTATLTCSTFLAGRISLAVGDSKGEVVVWFPVRSEGSDEPVLQPAHRLRPGSAAVTSLAGSGRSRLLAVGYGNGTIRLYNATNERLLGTGEITGQVVVGLAVAPREDLLLVSGLRSESLWSVAAEYGDVSGRTLIGRIWYEGYPAPAFVWQSSAASDGFEPKLSLVPLIFGTLKATFYSLLVGLPLAFLAAIYTSEFLSRGARARVKPVIEIMASLPSVVLGFLAALVVAPWLEQVVVQALCVVLAAPFLVLLGAHLWQFLPRRSAARLDRWRPAAVTAALGPGAAAAWGLAPGLERLAFAGDFKAWLAGQAGSALSGWVLLLLVPTAAVVAWVSIRYGDGILRSRGPRWSSSTLALLDLGRFLAATAATLAAALFLAWLLNGSGWDPRGSVFDTYVQRNALVVGIAMGFAIIPLIYTIAEDALVSVPDHLRAASLGAGVTPWQTAMRVVVPPAMSGLFSAAMIGLGRAVGETMIVLMAAGNTPIMDLNIFNGFRTLSANLAVELPEAVQNSTHYRTLFLAALVLFALTFALNTVAEVVRLHFRRQTSRL